MGRHGAVVRRPLLIWAMVGVLALLLAACPAEEQVADPEVADPEVADPDPDGEVEPVEEPEEVELTRVSFLISWFLNGSDIPFYLARELGYFAEEGLEVEIEHIRGTAETLALIATGGADIGEADLSSMAILRETEEADLVAVMGVKQQAPMSVVSMAEAGIETPHDLPGKKIVDFAGSSTSIVWPVFLAEQGIDPGQIDMENVEPGSRIPLVLEGQADGAVVFFTDNEPVLAERCECPVNVLAWKDYGIDSLGDGVIVRGDFLRDNPDVVAGFVRALQRASLFTWNNPEEATQILLDAADDIDASFEVALQTITNEMELWTTPNSEGEPLGFMALEDWEATIDLLVRTGQLDERIDPQALYTNEFLDPDIFLP